MPSVDTFEQQPAPYRESVLPSAVKRRLAIEAGATQSWWKFVGRDGDVIGVDRFGESGKGAELFREFGFTMEHIRERLAKLLRS
jgi:transketolase